MKSKNKNTLTNNNNTKINKNTNKNNKAVRINNNAINNKAITRIKNWSRYNEGMINRGRFRELTKIAVRQIGQEAASRAFKQHKSSGHPKEYPDALILIIAVYREIFQLSFREVEGFARDVLKEFNIEVPNYVTIERRIGSLHIDLRLDKRRLKGDLYVLADSTGYKIFGEGEWKAYKHGRSKKRIWAKAHYAIDYNSQQIVGLTVTIHTRGDNLEAPNLLDKAKKNFGSKGNNIAEVADDGAYNTRALKKFVEEECKAKLITPPKIKAKSNGKKFIGADIEANKRCEEVGRKQWKEEVGYHKRSLVETNMFRLKSPFGDKLRCRTIKNQTAELTIRAMILNIWTNKWMPKYTKP